MRLLVVEDEPAMASVLSRGLAEEGFAVDVATNGEDGWWYVAEHDYDAVLLDAMLPGRDGFTLLADLRAAGGWVPVLFLTARDAVDDRVRGLDLGADDYVTKPFAFPELLARLRALLRRGARERPCVLAVGELLLDPARRSVQRGAVSLVLTAKEFAVLECFMRRPGEVLTRTELIDHVWDDAFDNDSNIVDVYVASLRAKIGRTAIETVRGVGYRLADGHAEKPPA
ncbi:MAG TPA: response regulator transcription factor [Jatrophihabitans sp.]|jgi:two-component system OmpR family response regulator|nr:response regulator transcription factor [Jatrophihabitans sp.]